MPKNTRLTQSQPSGSHRGQRSTHHGAVSRSLTQTGIDQHLAPSQTIDIDEQVNNCVRFIIYNCGHNGFVRRNELQKQCTPKAGHQFQQIIEKASEILKNVDL